VIRDGENGLLVDFFGPGDIADRVVTALMSPKALQPLRNKARQDVEECYSLAQGEQRYRALIDRCASQITR